MTAGILSVIVHAALGAVVGFLLGDWRGLLIGLAVGLLLGLVFGWAVGAAEVYDLRSVSGVLLFVLDHTWSLANTVAGALFLSINRILRNRLDRTQSRHSGAVVLANGVFPGFATTIGTVQAGTTPTISLHEGAHVTQARIFGPLYIPLVLANYALATIAPYWLIYHDRVNRPIDGFRAYFIRGVYPNTWNERWAYRVEGTPPL